MAADRTTALPIAKWVGIAIASLVAIVVLALLTLDTGVGKRFIADRLAGYSTASGMNFRTSRIEVSIYGRMVIHDLGVRDPKGAVLTAPMVIVDWRPLAYLHGKIDVRELSAASMHLIRKLLSQTGSFGGSTVSLRYKKVY